MAEHTDPPSRVGPLYGWREYLAQLQAADTHPTTHREKLISAFGGFLGILMVLWSSSHLLDYHGAAMFVASMGASAVLLFAVPHGSLSQPWPLFGGHLISALIGVTCAQFIGDTAVAAAAAVGLAIGAMYYLHCIHPPGGATALVPVIGGEAVYALGYEYLLTPVLLNVAVVFAMAVLANLPFRGRRYPVRLARPATDEPDRSDSWDEPQIAHSDLVYALSQIDSFIDVTEEDLLRIYHLAVQHTHRADTHQAQTPALPAVACEG